MLYEVRKEFFFFLILSSVLLSNKKLEKANKRLEKEAVKS
jgi:hypothetical protein